MIEAIRKKLGTLRGELGRDDLDAFGRVLRVAQLSLVAARLTPTLAVGHEIIFELAEPPKPFRGLRDLNVRRATEADLEALFALDDEVSRETLAGRFARGNLCYVGELDGRILAEVWFHRGPLSFDEDAWLYPRFMIPEDTFWSFHALALPEARASGVFVKVFHVALRELFVEHGGRRVQCRVKASNQMSVLLHERSGFHRLGTLVAVGVPGARWIQWESDGHTRRWFGRRSGDLAITLPPEPA